MQYQEISANFERKGDKWVAQAIEIPELYASGQTLTEARDNLLEAARKALATQGVLAAEDEFAQRIANPN